MPEGPDRPWSRLGTDPATLQAQLLRDGPAHPAHRSRVSRSHRPPWHALAAWRGPVGVDVERVEAWTEVQAVGVLTPDEVARFRSGGAGPAEMTSVWSAKEALAKALGDAVAYDPRRLDSPHHWRDGRAGPWRGERLDAPEGHVAWLVWRV